MFNQTNVTYSGSDHTFGLIVFLQILCVLVVLDNIMVIIVFTRKNMTAPSYLFMTLLAIAEIIEVLGYTFRFFPDLTSTHVMQTSVALVWLHVYLFPYFVLNGLTLSILSALCISTDRFVAICQPTHMQRLQNRKFGKQLTVTIWIFSALFHIPYFWFFLIEKKIVNGLELHHYDLNDDYVATTPFKIYSIFRDILLRITPGLLILAMNIKSLTSFKGTLEKRRSMAGTSQQRRHFREENQLFLVQILTAISFFSIAMCGSINFYAVDLDSTPNIHQNNFRSFVMALEVIVLFSTFFIHMTCNTKFFRTWKSIFWPFNKKKDANNSGKEPGSLASSSTTVDALK